MSPKSEKILAAPRPAKSLFGCLLRRRLGSTRRYHESWNEFERSQGTERPKFDPVWEEFRGLFKKEFPVSVHTQRYQLVMKSILMLLDSQDPDEWSFYTASYDKIGKPVRRWPSDSLLARDFNKVKRYLF